MRLIEIVIWFDNNYKRNESIYVDEDLTKEEITKKIVKEYGNDWYSFDINI